MRTPDAPFRDATAGASSYRQDLLKQRRFELLEMPPAIRKVVVARFGRLVAAALVAAIAGTLVVSAWLGSPAFLTDLLPGPAPALLTSLLALAWCAVAVGQLGGRLAGERAFTRATTRSVSPTQDTLDDIHRLEEQRPTHAAQALALGIEAASVAAPVLAASWLLPATAVVLGRALTVQGAPSVDELENALAAAAPTLRALAVGGVTLALAMRVALRGRAVPLLSRVMARLVRGERSRLGLDGEVAVALDAPLTSVLGRALLGVTRPVARAARAAGARLTPLFAGRRRRALVVGVAFLALAGGADRGRGGGRAHRRAGPDRGADPHRPAPAHRHVRLRDALALSSSFRRRALARLAQRLVDLEGQRARGQLPREVIEQRPRGGFEPLATERRYQGGGLAPGHGWLLTGAGRG